MKFKKIKFAFFTFFSILILILTSNCAMGFTDIESKLIFYPINRAIADIRLNLACPMEDTYFYSNDGIKLNAWYIQPDKGKPVIIYCHGQGENISLWQDIAQFLTDYGYGIFMLEYRGHGRSKGEPSEKGLYLDLESAIKYMKDYKNIEPDNIVLWGRSLGGAVVTDVASRSGFKGVILESTFTNIRDVGVHLTSTGILESDNRFWSNIATNFVKCFPLTQTFQSDKKVQKIKSPLLIAHSIHDETVPVNMSKELAKTNPKAELYISNHGSHNSSEWVKDKILKFLKSLG
jgi:fermentation-respiration switch protein FrsA (DUF1100 family)